MGAVKKLPGLSAFFPAFDEERTVIEVARQILAVVSRVAERGELIIVDDGSRDRTGQLADSLARADPAVRVIHHRVNRGYGAAVRSGLAAARLDYVFATDGDGQFDPAQIERLLGGLAAADVVVGYRRGRADHVLRRANTWAWNRLVRALFHLPVRDVNCAFKLFRRDAVAGLALRANGAMISTELLVRVLQRGHRIAEVPVDHAARRHGVATGGHPRVIAEAFTELVRLAPSLWDGMRALGTPPAAGVARGEGRPMLHA
jgi:glycosyltransferase involved in cell wall biosynthesis